MILGANSFYMYKVMSISKESEQWDQVTNLLCEDRWQVYPDWLVAFQKSPHEFTHMLSYYKFAAKTIARSCSVLEINCHFGMGISILAEFAMSYTAIESSKINREYLQSNLRPPKFNFYEVQEFVNTEQKIKYDSLVQVNFSKELSEDFFFQCVDRYLKDHGRVLLGVSTASKTLEEYEQLISKMEQTFEVVVPFFFRNEIAQCGKANQNEFSFLLGCSKKGLF